MKLVLHKVNLPGMHRGRIQGLRQLSCQTNYSDEQGKVGSKMVSGPLTQSVASSSSQRCHRFSKANRKTQR